MDKNILDDQNRIKSKPKGRLLSIVLTILTWIGLSMVTFENNIPADGFDRIGFPMYFIEFWYNETEEQLGRSILKLGAALNVIYLIVCYIAYRFVIQKIHSKRTLQEPQN